MHLTHFKYAVCAIYDTIEPMAGKKIQNWAFVAPKMSRDLSEYFEGILDFIKDDPSVFVHAFTFEDPNIAILADMDGRSSRGPDRCHGSSARSRPWTST